jgi:phosphoenolpyruvate synthase/pyruvate phosphate dikinase
MTKRDEPKSNSEDKPTLIKWFSELGEDSSDIAGEKGVNLAEIYNLKLPIPPGFIVTTQAYDYFIENSPELKEQIRGLLEKINYENPELLKDISEVIRNKIIEAKIPAELEEEIIDAYEALGASDLSEVHGSALDILHNAQEPIFAAVRSSLIKEYPNEKQEFFLNIKGISKIIDHIKRCFASLFTPNAIYYRKKNALTNSPINIAVIIQKMVDSDKSGQIFSKDEYENMLIEAIWGLGEGISLGIVPTDKYLLNKNMEIIKIEPAEKEIAITRDSSGNKTSVKLREEKSKQQVLTKRDIKKLYDLTTKIEEHYKSPQKIEFAIEGEEVYIVQTKSLENKEQFKENINEDKIEEVNKEDTVKETSKENIKKEISKREVQPATAKTKTKIKLMVNSPLYAEKASQTGIKSVGLVEIEEIISNSRKHPNYYLGKGDIKDYEEVIFKGVNDIAKHFDELWVRTSDIRTDELAGLEGAPKEKEANPLLGLHGIRFSLKNLKILEAELNALKRVSEEGKQIGIMLPKVISIEEVQKVKDILKKINFKNAQIGVIIETPAAIQIINQLCDEGIHFISFGMNNLTQYMLAIDKGNDEVQSLYNEMHPAILYQLAYVIRVCKKRNVKSSIYGQTLSKKEMIKFLIENGIDSISVNADSASEIANYVKEIEDNLIKGTDKEPRKYNPKENTGEEVPSIKGVEKLH